MILITGATGTIGSDVVLRLQERGVETRSMVRDLSRANGPAVLGDFADPASLRGAVEGVEAVLMVTPFSPDLGAHDLALIEAATAAGVKKVVKLSAIGTGDSDDPDDVRTWHAHGERALMASGMAWTVLRPSTFATNAAGWADLVKSGAPIPNMTGEGAQGHIVPADVAAVAVEALTTAGHEGRAYTLTGPELLTTAGQVAAIAGATGLTIETSDVPIEAAKAGMLAAGAPAALADLAATGWAFVRDGGNAILTTTVEDVLGRPAATFASWARANKALFTP
ncbi:NAD(P)H-binding protein [Nonomuraea sp. NBC_01738]|uniref:NAD(P)H-binding protein n=1 Tax=Nonomuraea sp. NBC_01738 TaxID=2976003 RepID=UPI002E111E7A|nr:NAD(P)H-binding protein [Nonomuraea sp. NBC_01738]